MNKPIRTLECCCCGEATRGRQWWNRDTGYGMCTKCIKFVREHGESEEEIKSNYGIEGVHWGVPSELSEILAEALREDAH